MKKIVIALILGVSGLVANAQITDFPDLIPDHTPMMNDTWEAIDKMMYKVSTVGNKKVYTPHYPPVLKSLENKTVELPGYMVPLTSGRNHSTFMISVLPLAQCQFCGTNGIPPMVEVKMKNNQTIRFADDPIKIRGKLVFTPEPLKGNSEVQVVDAVLVR